jgi:hypothetical protein
MRSISGGPGWSNGGGRGGVVEGGWEDVEPAVGTRDEVDGVELGGIAGAGEAKAHLRRGSLAGGPPMRV